MDGPIAPSELYEIPDFDPALDSRVGSLTISTKPGSTILRSQPQDRVLMYYGSLLLQNE